MMMNSICPSWASGHCNEVEEIWFGRPRKYFVLTWFKRKKKPAVWEPWCVGKAQVIQSNIPVSSLLALRPTLHSHHLTSCRGLFPLHINCAMETLCIAQRLLIQSVLAHVQRCMNKVKQLSVWVQIWKWFSHFYMIWNMKNKLYWHKTAPFIVYLDHSTNPGKPRSATSALLTWWSHVRFSKLLLRKVFLDPSWC